MEILRNPLEVFNMPVTILVESIIRMFFISDVEPTCLRLDRIIPHAFGRNRPLPINDMDILKKALDISALFGAHT